MHIGDHTFDEWVQQYQRLLFGIAYWWTGSRTDAEELTQEAFFQAYRSRSSLREIEAVKGWLVGILRHCHSQMYRKGRSRAEIPLEEVIEGSSGATEFRSSGVDRDDSLALHQALKRLDERHRLPLVLFYFQDLSYREIAEALELPLGTVMSRLSRARQMLHASLAGPVAPAVAKKIGGVSAL